MLKIERNCMNAEEIELNRFIKIIGNLAKLHEWEMKNFPLMTSLTGRMLYFRIAQRALGDGKDLSKAMKELMGDGSFTEKALRSRLQQMEDEGYIVTVHGEADARFKAPIPTDKFYAAIYLHAEQVRRIFDEDYLMIDK